MFFEGLRKVGTWLFDFVIITILLSLSLALVFPFPLILIGVHNYFEFQFEDRRLANIFNWIKEDWKITLKFSLLWGAMVILPIVVLVIANSNGFHDNFISGVCYVVLILSVILITDAPRIILKMNVNLRQLLFNCITLIYGCWYLLLLAFLITIGYFVVLSYFPYIGGVGLYFIAYLGYAGSKKAMDKIKSNISKKRNSLENPKEKDETTK